MTASYIFVFTSLPPKTTNFWSVFNNPIARHWVLDRLYDAQCQSFSILDSQPVALIIFHLNLPDGDSLSCF
jgi:hypothetical protein